MSKSVTIVEVKESMKKQKAIVMRLKKVISNRNNKLRAMKHKMDVKSQANMELYRQLEISKKQMTNLERIIKTQKLMKEIGEEKMESWQEEFDQLEAEIADKNEKFFSQEATIIRLRELNNKLWKKLDPCDIDVDRNEFGDGICGCLIFWIYYLLMCAFGFLKEK